MHVMDRIITTVRWKIYPGNPMEGVVGFRAFIFPLTRYTGAEMGKSVNPVSTAVEGGKGFSNHGPSFILWCFLIRPSQKVLFRGSIHYV